MTRILQGNVIKKAHKKQAFTKKQIEELKKCAFEAPNGHLYFMENYGYLIGFDRNNPEQRGRILYKAFEYQKQFIENIHNNRFSINMLSRQMGKALYENTKILTPHGFVLMKDLKVGDYVYTEMGGKTKIIYKTERQLDRNCYEIEFHNGEKIIADEDHLWKIDNLSDYAKNLVLKTKKIKELFSQYVNYNKIFRIKNHIYDSHFYIKSINACPSVPVYCIEVDNPTHLFLAGETLIPTHNCVSGDTLITVRNNDTNEEFEMSIEEFMNMFKS